jgi:hypothetical protein
MRIFTRMTLFVKIAGFSSGPAAVQNRSVRNRVNYDAFSCTIRMYCRTGRVIQHRCRRCD